MAFDLQKMSVDYKQLLRMVPTQRQQLAQSGTMNDLISALTPGQLVSLFPRYYRQSLPDVGQINKYAASLDVALSNVPSRGRAYEGGTYTQTGTSGGGPSPSPSMKTTITPEQKAVQDLMQEAGVGGNAPIGTQGVEEGRPERMKMTYDAFTSAGFSHKQALALTAEVGRENGFQEKYMFGTHSDPYNNATNLGMLSMQGPRLKHLKEHLMTEGRFDVSGQLIQDQETMNSMAKFYMKEMQSTEKSKKTSEFLSNPDIDQERAAYLLGTGYIRWRYKDKRYAHHHGYRDRYYDEVDKITSDYVKRIESAEDSVKQLESVITEFEPSMLEQMDERYQQWYKNANEQQKRLFEKAVEKLGIERFNERMKEVPLNSATLQAAGTKIDSESTRETALNYFDNKNRNPDGANLVEVDDRMLEIAEMGVRKFEADNPNLKVEIYGPSSGKRQPGRSKTTKSQHLEGNALDFEIFEIDPETGNKVRRLPNYRTQAGAGKAGDEYLKLHQNIDLARIYKKDVLEDSRFKDTYGRSGALFGGSYAFDAQHYDIGGKAGRGRIESADQPGGSIFGGYSNEYMKNYGITDSASLNVDTKDLPELAKQIYGPQDEIKKEAESIAQGSPVTATQAIVEQQATSNTAPALATGGLKNVPPGENIVGINTTTGQPEFFANDRENIRVEPGTLENKAKMPEITREDVERLEAPNQPLQQKAPRPTPTDNTDPNMYSNMTGEYSPITPSAMRASNRARLYNEDSTGLVNGHFK